MSETAMLLDADSVAPVLFVDHAEAMGGAEHSLLLLLKHLDRRHYRPILACNPGPVAEEARRQGIPTRFVPMPRIRGRLSSPWALACGIWRLVRIIRQEHIALVHSNAMRASFYAGPAARLARRPVVLHIRDIHRERWYPRLACRLCDQVIAVSRAAAGPIPCRHNVCVIYNGLDIAPFDRADGRQFRSEIGATADQPLVGIVGRIWPWKGQREFLDAAARVAARYPQARFVVVGDTSFPSERNHLDDLKAYAGTLGLSDRVVFTGHHSNIPTVMAGLDLLVHASRAEPFGRVLIEAMAARCPVIAFADGGVPEIVVHDQTGLLVPPVDVPELATAIEELLVDPGRRARMGCAARRRVAQLFTAEQMTHGVEAVYDGLLRPTRDDPELQRTG